MDVLTKAENYFRQLKDEVGDYLYFDNVNYNDLSLNSIANNDSYNSFNVSSNNNINNNITEDDLSKQIKKTTKQTEIIEKEIIDKLNKSALPDMKLSNIKDSEDKVASDFTADKIESPIINQELEKSIAPLWAESKTLDELNNAICNCMECPLGVTRNKFVFGKGNPNADIMFIGEGPGADEDAQGEPFVGRAGQLLTKIIESIEFQREDVFIANIVKCRPPNNRRPLESEVSKCEPYLKKQIQLIKPQFIVALGLTAVETLFKTKYKMGDIRGSMMNYEGIRLLVTYHPAALLRNPEWKRPVWEDMKLLKKLYIEYKQNLNNK